MNIPDEAVEAAARVNYEARASTKWALLNNYAQARERSWMRIALEAAAPHMSPTSDILALCDKADQDRGSMYCKLTTYEIRQALGANNE